MNYEEETIAF